MPKTKSVSKTEFAKLIGVTPARVSQLLLRGLPTLAGDRIDPTAGRAWLEAHVAPSRGGWGWGLRKQEQAAKEEQVAAIPGGPGPRGICWMLGQLRTPKLRELPASMRDSS